MSKLSARRLLALIAAELLILQTAFAVSFQGEEILANPESLRAEHEEFAFAIVEGLARYAMDEIGSAPLTKVSVADSPAVTAVRRFDGGWFYTHKSSKFENRRTENWRGNGQDAFSCDCYMDCVVHVRGDLYQTYDMAYRLDFILDPNVRSGSKWRLQRFQNIPQEPDSVDMAQINVMDEGITVETVTGPTFKGFMVIVEDPSRVYVGALPSFQGKGWTLDEFAEKTGAAVVVNGGAFSDPNGMGAGDEPVGVVYSEGVKRRNHVLSRNSTTLVGFNQDDRLIVRQNLSPDKVEAFNLRDAVAFRPALLIDGEVIESTENRDISLSARTAIGQREDGAVLLLIVDGRQPDSFGANMSYLTQIMRNYGAVNAANLDGGSSTALVFFGKKINDGSGPDRVSRRVPTAFLVRPLDE